MVTAQNLMDNLAVQVYIIISLYGLKGKRFEIMYDVHTFLQVVNSMDCRKTTLNIE